jgi:hypothetical protein
MADCAVPSPEGARALQHAQAAAARFGASVRVEAAALSDAGIQQLGIGLEPTVLVGDFVVAVGMAPPAGHLVRALEAALAKEATR